MRCTVVFAAPGQEWWLSLDLREGATVGDALVLAQSRVMAGGLDVPAGLDWSGVVGVFGEVCPRSRPLQEGDRIELYRPLRNDPKEARRRRATERAKGPVRSRR